MKIELTPRQKTDRARFREFVDKEILPYANLFDREERLPSSLIEGLASRGYLGLCLPLEFGGGGKDMITYGILNGEIGRGCSSTRSLLTVHGMVGRVITRWGTSEQKKRWLPELASGKTIAAFALSEPGAGSDAYRIRTTACRDGSGYVLDGIKKWISFGQVADLFLVFARSDEKYSAFLVERDRPGLTTDPIKNILGVRASMLAEVRLENCSIPEDHLIGREGFGLSHIASSALDEGRYSVAWGCVGIAQCCMEACIDYTNAREQSGSRLKDHQLIREMLSNMITNLRAARLLCYQAGYYKDSNHPDAMVATLIAKYFSSTMATRVASDAVQIHGANGCCDQYPVQRLMRDAKIMEIIEGSTQIQQITIPNFELQDF